MGVFTRPFTELSTGIATLLQMQATREALRVKREGFVREAMRTQQLPKVLVDTLGKAT